jgi:hypothetical protein
MTYAVALFMGAVIFATEPLDMSIEECDAQYSENAASIATDLASTFDPQVLDMLSTMVVFKCVETLPTTEISDGQWNQLLGIDQ